MYSQTLLQLNRDSPPPPPLTLGEFTEFARFAGGAVPPGITGELLEVAELWPFLG